MTTHDQLLPRGALATSDSPAPLCNWVKSIALRLTVWAETCADHWAAAAMYEQLSVLSDTELARRDYLAQPWRAITRRVRPRF